MRTHLIAAALCALVAAAAAAPGQTVVAIAEEPGPDRHRNVSDPPAGYRDLYAWVLPKPFNWAVLESVSVPASDNKHKDKSPPDDRDLAVGFLALRGKTVGRKEAPVYLASWYNKEKDFPQPPSKHPNTPPTIGLPSGEGLGMPTSSLAVLLTAVVEYNDTDGDLAYGPEDKVVKRVWLSDGEFDRIEKGTLPDLDLLPSDSDDAEPSPPSSDPDKHADDNLVVLTSTSLSRPSVRLRLVGAHRPVFRSPRGLLLHPRSTLVRLAVRDFPYAAKGTRLAVEGYLAASRRGENRTELRGFAGEGGLVVSNGGEGPEAAFFAAPGHVHAVRRGGNGTHEAVPLFAKLGEALGKEGLKELMAGTTGVVRKALGQYPGLQARAFSLSFGGPARPHAVFMNLTVGLGTDAVPHPLNHLLPSAQHGPAFTHGIAWAVGAPVLFAAVGAAAAAAFAGTGGRAQAPPA